MKRLLAAVMLLTCIQAVAAEIPSSEVAMVTSAISNEMKDPMSTMVKDMVADRSLPDMYIVCGKVNGKNSYGGYVGYQQFHTLIIFNRDKGFAISSVFSVGEVARIMCQQKGLI